MFNPTPKSLGLPFLSNNNAGFKANNKNITNKYITNATIHLGICIA